MWIAECRNTFGDIELWVTLEDSETPQLRVLRVGLTSVRYQAGKPPVVWRRTGPDRCEYGTDLRTGFWSRLGAAGRLLIRDRLFVYSICALDQKCYDMLTIRIKLTPAYTYGVYSTQPNLRFRFKLSFLLRAFFFLNLNRL